jgi:hypothetical protein
MPKKILVEEELAIRPRQVLAIRRQQIATPRQEATRTASSRARTSREPYVPYDGRFGNWPYYTPMDFNRLTTFQIEEEAKFFQRSDEEIPGRYGKIRTVYQHCARYISKSISTTSIL